MLTSHSSRTFWQCFGPFPQNTKKLKLTSGFSSVFPKPTVLAFWTHAETDEKYLPTTKVQSKWCFCRTQKLHTSLTPSLSSRTNYVEVKIYTGQCSRRLFQRFCSGAAGKKDAKVKQTSVKDWISSSLEPILLNAEKLCWNWHATMFALPFCLKTFNVFSPSLIR